MDRYKQHRIIFAKLCAIFSICGTIFTIYGLFQTDIWFLYLASLLGGISNGLYNMTVSTILADSTPTGGRSVINTIKTNCFTVICGLTYFVLFGLFITFFKIIGQLTIVFESYCSVMV